MSRHLEYGIATKKWQPVLGCREGLRCAESCWLKKVINRLAHSPNQKIAAAHQGLVNVTPDGLRWTGTVRTNPGHMFDPLKWHKPETIAAGYHGDWALLSDGDIMRTLDVMARCWQHIFVTLTKRPEQLVEWLEKWEDTKEDDHEPKLARGPKAVLSAHKSGRAKLFAAMLEKMGKPPQGAAYPLYDWMQGPRYWPSVFPNIYIGVSLMCQADADQHLEAMRRISQLGWKTLVSYEPALGPIDWEPWKFLNFVIAGGQTGKKAAPAHPDWFRAVRDFCAKHGIGFNFKQQGEHEPILAAFDGWNAYADDPGLLRQAARECVVVWPDGRIAKPEPDLNWWSQDFDGEDKGNPTGMSGVALVMRRVGKKVAGRLLDEREHNDLPGGAR